MFIILISYCLLVVKSQTIILGTSNDEYMTIDYTDGANLNYDTIIITFPDQYVLQLSKSYVCQGASLNCYATQLSDNVIQISDPKKIYFLGVFIRKIDLLQVDYSNFYGIIQIQLNGELIKTLTAKIQLKSQSIKILSIEYMSKYSYTKTEMILTINSKLNIASEACLVLEFTAEQMGSDNLYFSYNNELLSYSQDGQVFTINLFQKDYPSNQQFSLVVGNIYTKFSQGFQPYLIYYAIYNLEVIGSVVDFIKDVSIQIPSEPKIINLIGSTLVSDQVNRINFQILPRLRYPLNSQIIIKFPDLQTFDQSIIKYNLVSNANLVPISNINPIYALSFFTNGIIVKQFNSQDDQSMISFDLQGIRNPIGLSQLNIDITIQESTKSLIEQSLQSLLIKPSLISNLKISVQNSTIFAKTKIIINFTIQNRQSLNSVINLQIPSQIQILQDSVTIKPKQKENIKIQDQNIIISQYFLFDQNIQDIQMEFIGILPNYVCETDSLKLYTFDQNTNGKISELQDQQGIQIIESTFSLISFLPNDFVTDYQTTYALQFKIPEVKQGSLFELYLPQFYAEQSNLCSAIIGDEASFCQNTLGVINIIINKGGILEIFLYNIRTERSVSQHSYLLSGIIYNQGIIHSKLLDGQFDVKLITPQTLYDYELTISNLYYGKDAQYIFQFDVHSTIYKNDYLIIQLPLSITYILECNQELLQQGNRWFQISVIEGQNTIQCDFINPLNDDPILPFRFSIFSQEGYQIAYFEDIFGIQDKLISNSLDFSIQQSSYYLNDLTNLSINYQSSFGVQRFGSLQLLIDSTIYFPNNLQCFDIQGKQIFQTLECESNVNETQTKISSTATNSITIGQNSLIFTGLKLGSTYTGMFNAKFALLNINQFGIIIESSSIKQNIQLKCMEKCLECSNYFNNCTKCEQNYVLYGQICLSECPIGMQVSKDKKCLSCMTDQKCNLCNTEDVTKCITCTSGYELIDGYCIRLQNNTIQQDSTINNTQNNTTNSNNQGSQQQSTKQSNDMYDGIPFIIIVMSLFLLISLIQKILKKKTLAMKQFYLYASLIDFPVTILRIIRFQIISDLVYQYLSNSCLTIVFLTQISNSFHLQFSIKKKKNELQVQGHQIKTESMLLYQWRIMITYTLTEQLVIFFKKLLNVQLMSHILPIVIMMSYIIQKNHFYFFAFDDIIYNLTMLLLQLTHKRWMQESENQIYPLKEEPKSQVREDENKKYVNLLIHNQITCGDG